MVHVEISDVAHWQLELNIKDFTEPFNLFISGEVCFISGPITSFVYGVLQHSPLTPTCSAHNIHYYHMQQRHWSQFQMLLNLLMNHRVAYLVLKLFLF